MGWQSYLPRKGKLSNPEWGRKNEIGGQREGPDTVGVIWAPSGFPSPSLATYLLSFSVKHFCIFIIYIFLKVTFSQEPLH